jgi:hypothetical protein
LCSAFTCGFFSAIIAGKRARRENRRGPHSFPEEPLCVFEGAEKEFLCVRKTNLALCHTR